MRKFRGGFVFKAHTRVYQSTLCWRVTKQKKKNTSKRARIERDVFEVTGREENEYSALHPTNSTLHPTPYTLHPPPYRGVWCLSVGPRRYWSLGCGAQGALVFGCGSRGYRIPVNAPESSVTSSRFPVERRIPSAEDGISSVLSCVRLSCQTMF